MLNLVNDERNGNQNQNDIQIYTRLAKIRSLTIRSIGRDYEH